VAEPLPASEVPLAAADPKAQPEIPDRLFFRIGDVAEISGLEAYVLRYWESEFPMLSPKKASNGHREYRRKDVETILEIKRLLYDEGYTIAGARKALRERTKTRRRKAATPKTKQAALFGDPASEASRKLLAEIKTELRGILDMLK
jgi:DNA-binding transcriptional MerR regulator